MSGALKRRTGPAPWRQLARQGLLDVGESVVTDGGRLPRQLIHVASLHATWRASEYSVVTSTRNATLLAWELGCCVVAMPLIGAGTGGLSPERVHSWMAEAVSAWVADPDAADVMEVRLIRWSRRC